MAFQLQVKQSLPYVLHEFIQGAQTQEYLRNITDAKRKLIEGGCYSVGRIISDKLTKEEVEALSAIGIILPRPSVDIRILLHGTYFYSKFYGRIGSRRNDICAFRLMVDGTIKYGEILSYCVLPPWPAHDQTSICFIEQYHLTARTPLSSIRPPRNMEMRSMYATVQNILCKKIVGVRQNTSIIAVTLKNIIKKCIKIPPVLRDGNDYIIPLPNKYEVH